MARRALLLIFAFQVTASLVSAQFCRLSVAGLNRSRRVTGAVHAECPELIIHTAPFGNWGVTSNFGAKQNGHQFQGWCHDAYICDNYGTCATTCRDGWYEWNSCTDIDRFRAPNCSLYNAADCTEQSTATGVNVHGTRSVDIPVRCPSDSDGDGILDQGGCGQLTSVTNGTNFMSVYELDPIGPDDLVQTMYFPPTPVALACDGWGCAPASSPWVAPSFYDSPSSPSKVFAEMAMVVNWGAFIDPARACQVSAPVLSTVSAATFLGPTVAPESIASAFGAGLAPTRAGAASVPLPTSLAGMTVTVTDRIGIRRPAPLFYVSPTQVNFLIPPGIVAGPSTVSIFRGDFLLTSATVQVEPVAPGLFTANADGKGVASAILVRTRPDDSQTFEPVFQCGSDPGSCLPAPIEFGSNDRLALALFGTGVRGRSALSAVSVTIAGESADVFYAGPQGQYVGLDQVNVVLPPVLRGRGEVSLVLTVDGKRSNPVTIYVR